MKQHITLALAFSLSVLFVTPARACPISYNLYDYVVQADIIAKMEISDINTTVKREYLEYRKDTVELHYQTITYTVNKMFKGASFAEHSISRRYTTTLTHKPGDVFYGFLSTRSDGSFYLSHMERANETSNYPWKLTLNDQLLEKLVDGLKECKGVFRAETKITTIKTIINAMDSTNYLALMQEYTSTSFVTSSSREVQPDHFNVVEKQKINAFFQDGTMLPELLTALAYGLNEETFRYRLHRYIQTYYCNMESSQYDGFDPQYAYGMEYYFYIKSQTPEEQLEAAAYALKRLQHMHEPDFEFSDFILFQNVYPSANIFSSMDKISDYTLDWETRKEAEEMLLTEIATHHPTDDEKPIRTNICTPPGTKLPKLAFSIAPNPADNVSLVYLKDIDPDESVYIDVTSQTGQMVKQVKHQPFASSDQVELSTSDLPKGHYFLVVYNNQSRDVKMLVVE